jgi:enamine deaminase RidA (YjgF/YER057c/UK114 family)
MNRMNISSGAPWESVVGYSRAVRMGNHIWVAGTTATDENGNVIGKGDAAAQTRYALEKIGRALGDAGATMRDVVRTRIFVTDIGQWEAIGRVHGEFFGDIRPAATMVEVSRLIDPAHLVEIEVDAFVGECRDPPCLNTFRSRCCRARSSCRG